ncbi:Uncharacterised protein [Mycobacteroides abscessus subsp. abscessus]|nr:Uncharacterised protein [Mycobacteroides abscessus subsp. abscessus]
MVSSPKVPKDFGAGALWKIEASRWVLPTPKPPSRYRPAPVTCFFLPNRLFLPAALWILATSRAKSSALRTAAAWLGSFGSGM